MTRVGNMSTFLLLVGVCSLLQVQAGPMRDKIDGLAGFTHKSPHEHHHKAGRAHPHEHLHEHEEYHDHHGHDHHHHPGHRCVHDEMEHPTVVRNFLNVHNASRINTSNVDTEPVTASRSDRQLLETGRWWEGAPGTDLGDSSYDETACQAVASATKGHVRIMLKEGEFESTLDAAKRTYLRNVMIEVMQWYQARLLVVPLTSNLVISSVNGGDGYVAGTSVSVDAADKTTGFANTDYALYWSAKSSTACSDSVIGHAAAFEVTECDRPLVGYINFCPNGITTTDVNTKQHLKQLTTGYHEVMHAFGYTNRMYAYWRTAGMAARTSRDANGVPNQGTTAVGLSDNGIAFTTFQIYTPDPSYFFSYTDTVLGGTRWKLNTTNVLAKAQAHFGCSTLDGVEMENQGTSGNWGSHWEKRIFGNEFITATANEIDSIVSQISLAAFEDMGWWGVDYSNNQQEFTWMKNAGCDTITQKCLTNGVPINSEYFCNETNSGINGVKTCTAGGVAVGYCNKGEQSGLASYYYYFGDTTTAGTAVAMYQDYCPTVVFTSNQICSGSKMDGVAIVGGVDYTTGQGQEYSSNSRCFLSTLRVVDASTNVVAGTAGCYKFQCLSTSQMQMYVFDSAAQNYTITCTTATSGQALSVLGFDGSITCVDPADAAVCGAEQSFPSLTNMTVVAGTTDLTSYLIPPFDISITSYWLNLGAAYSSLGITPTTTSSSAMTMTFTDSGNGETVGVGGQQYNTGLQPKWNTFSFKLVTASAQERTYSVNVIRGAGRNATKTITLTLNYLYSSITDWPSFRTNFTQELEKILALDSPTTWAPTAAPSKAPTRVPSQSPTITLSPSGAGWDNNTYSPSTAPTSPAPSVAPTVAPSVAPGHITLFQITEGSIKVQFTIQYIDNTQPEPIALDATLQNLFNNKDSVMFSNDYTYLRWAVSLQSNNTVIYCDAACANEYCNVETGICSTSGSEDDDGFPEWAFYVIIAVGLVFGGLVIYVCSMSCLKNCCKRKQRMMIDEETGEEIPAPPRVTFPPIDREAGRKETQTYMRLDETDLPILQKNSAKSNTGKFSAAMDDESSDDEVAGQI